MSDPFAPSSHDQLMREAQRGLAIFAILFAVLVYVAFDRYTGRSRQLPEHVRNAPVAKTVWPYANEAPDSASRHANRQRTREVDRSKRELVKQSESAAPTPPIAVSIGRDEAAKIQVDSQEGPALEKNGTPPKLQSKIPPALVASSTRDFTPLPGDRFSPSKKDKPYPHSSTPLIESHLIASSKSVDDSNSRLEAESNESKQNVAKKADFPLDPFESSKPVEKAVPLNQVVSHEEAQSNSQPASDYTSDISTFQPTPVKTANSNLTKGSLTIGELVGGEPELIAPNPTGVPSSKGHLTNTDPFVMPSTITDRTSVSSSLHPFDPIRKRNKGGVLLAPATETQVTARRSTFHIVAEGESLYSIAQHYYGDGDYFRALWHFNQINRRVAEDLSVGIEIEIPTAEQLQSKFPNEAPRCNGLPLHSATKVDLPDSSSRTRKKLKTASNSIQVCSAQVETTDDESDSASPTQAIAEGNYVTKEGETLFEIAANELGQASRYLEILLENREFLPDDVAGSTPLPANLRLLLPK